MVGAVLVFNSSGLVSLLLFDSFCCRHTSSLSVKFSVGMKCAGEVGVVMLLEKGCLAGIRKEHSADLSIADGDMESDRAESADLRQKVSAPD